MRRHINRIIFKKIHSKSGETIAETLVTMVVLSLAVLMLTGAVVSAAKVNQKADNTQTAFIADQDTGSSDRTIIITQNGNETDAETGREISITVNWHETENKYYYYEPK